MVQDGLFPRLLAQLLEIPILIYDGTQEPLTAFAQKNSFLTQRQPQMSAENLTIMLEAAKEHQLYLVQDALNIFFLFFCFESRTYLLGPFVTERWDDSTQKQLLLKAKVPDAYFAAYKTYYCSFHVLDTHILLHSVQAVICAMSPEQPPYNLRLLSSLAEKNPIQDFDKEPFDFVQAEKRYQAENDYIRSIKQGNEQGAMEALSRLNPMSLNLKLPYISEERRTTGDAVMRTLTRKAAESAGVNPAVVDAISQANSQRSHAARTPQEHARVTPAMVHDFCLAVRHVLQESYSPPVRRTVDYIMLHLNYPLTLEQLAGVVGLSTGYLSHIFRKETGKSILQYITETRCQKAAELLYTTDMPVQDVGMYVGYPDNNYFVKVFKKCYQTTPSEYKKKKHAPF